MSSEIVVGVPPWNSVRHLPRALIIGSVLLAQACVSIPVGTPVPTKQPPTAASVPSQPSSAPSAKPVPTATPGSTPTAPAATPGSTPSQAPTSTPGSTPAPTVTPNGRPTFATVADAYAQTADWHSCSIQGVPADCATVYVPTDYEQPALGTTAIAVARFHTSSSPQGDLFVNPGGPGAAGIGFAASLTRAAPTLAATYNIVGFDPRGTGQSDPLVCLGTAALDTLNAFDPTPDTAAARQQGINLVDAQGAACEQNSGLLADHVTTIETARDIDILRSAVGDTKLDYFGFSYGTYLGTTYAALFPDKVDRFVLDGALAPGLNTIEVSEVQTQGLQTAISAYIKDCVNNVPNCPLGSNVGVAASNLRQLLTNVDQNPMPTSDPARPLTQALAFYGIIDTLYNRSSWSSLTGALSAALTGDGQPLLALSDDYFGRSNGSYTSNLIQANAAINCLDEEVAGGPTLIPESTFVADSPIFGDIIFGMADRGCGDWPLKTTLTPPDYSAPGTPPILVVGTTRDPATPLIWAQQLAQTLSNGVLLTRNGDGHTAYLSGNRCIIQNVDGFLIGGVVPANGTRC